MLKHLFALAALGALAACASSNEASKTPSSPVLSGNAPSSGATVASSTVMNAASNTHWMAEERLLPQQPILAMVQNAGGVDAPVGFWMTCNPDNGAIKAHLARQDASRVGQTAVYTMRMGAQAMPLPGKFETGAGGSNFTFDWDSMGLRSVAQLDMVSFASDKGEVEWAFVRDPSAAVNAKYIGSLKDMARASQDFLNYCNPK